MVHGAHVESGTLVGMQATVLSRSHVGTGSLIAGGAVVLEGQQIPARSLAAGVPAKVRRELNPEESAAFIPHAARYVETARSQAPESESLRLEDVSF